MHILLNEKDVPPLREANRQYFYFYFEEEYFSLHPLLRKKTKTKTV